MKKIITTLSLCLLASAAHAGPVSRDQALRIAQDHFRTERSVRGVGQSAPTLNLAYECPSQQVVGSKNMDAPLYYVFNQGENQGYVIVSGDDRAERILAYVDKGKFDMSQASDGMRWWLQAVAAKITRLQYTQRSATVPVTAAATQNPKIKSEVKPLIQSYWGWIDDYNGYCPVDVSHGEARKCANGKLDVAMAQILAKWKGAMSPTGMVDYIESCHGLHLQANLDTFNIQWNKLPNSCHDNTECSEEAKDQVAKLIYACGLAAKSSYCMYGYPYNEIDVKHLENHLNIDRNIDMLNRYYYTEDEWGQILKEELSAGRPVAYKGGNTNNFNWFLCDGYNKEGLIHINWCSYGENDGYFSLSNLDQELSIDNEYTDGFKAFNKDQCMIIGIQPKQANSQETPRIYCNSIQDNGTQGNSIKVVVQNLYAFWNSYKGIFNLAAYDTNNNFVTMLSDDQYIEFGEHTYFDRFDMNAQVPDNLADGVYVLRLVSKTGQEDFKPVRCRKSAPYTPYVMIAVENHQATYIDDPALKEGVAIKMISSNSVGKEYKGSLIDLRFELVNNGKADYYGPLILIHEQVEGQPISERFISIKAGEEISVCLLWRLPEEGDKDVVSLWIANYDDDTEYGLSYGALTLGNFTIELKEAIPGTPKLTVLDYKITPEVPTPKDEYVDIETTITNSDGLYSDFIQFDAFSTVRNGLSHRSLYKPVWLMKGDTTTIKMRLPIQDLADDSYLVSANGLEGGQSYEIPNAWYLFYKYPNCKIHIDDSQGFTTMNALHAIRVPKGLKMGVVTGIKDGKLVIDYRYRYRYLVPANTPVIVKAEKPGDYIANYDSSSKPAPKDNLLQNRTDMGYIANCGKKDYQNYFFHEKKCAFVHTDNPIRIHHIHCYLSLPRNAGYAEEYSLYETTGIEEIEMEEYDENAPIFNLSGMRMNCNPDELPKGIYIIGNKKVIIP